MEVVFLIWRWYTHLNNRSGSVRVNGSWFGFSEVYIECLPGSQAYCGHKGYGGNEDIVFALRELPSGLMVSHWPWEHISAHQRHRGQFAR